MSAPEGLQPSRRRVSLSVYSKLPLLNRNVERRGRPLESYQARPRTSERDVLSLAFAEPMVRPVYHPRPTRDTAMPGAKTPAPTWSAIPKPGGHKSARGPTDVLRTPSLAIADSIEGLFFCVAAGAVAAGFIIITGASGVSSNLSAAGVS